MISANIIADSKNEFGNRVTTFILTYPRIIHSEIMTHRMFSRNAASSRAVPFDKLVKSIQTCPFVPIAWQKNHKGMQGTEYIKSQEHIYDCETEWLNARDSAIMHATTLNKDGDVTKQLCNRLLEPYQYYTVIVTATEWENFFSLRCPQYQTNEGIKRSWKDTKFDSMATIHERLEINKGQAEIHLMQLAECMWDAYNESIPRLLSANEWHIPFADQIKDPKIFTLMYNKYGEMKQLQPDWAEKFWLMKAQISTAMCARVSYTVVGDDEKEPNYENDIKLHDRLLESKHMSPFEHCARAMNDDRWIHKQWSGNLKGFVQYRKIIES